MRGNTSRLFMLVAGLPLLAPLTGCFMATDLLNPGVLSAIGFDPETIIPPQGRVVIAFQNSTQGVALFAAAVSDDVRDVTSNVVMASATNVAANETRTMVVDCPVGIVTPALFAVVLNDAITEVAYNGAPLAAGTDFVCGDVIEMRLVQVGDGAAADVFEIQIRVLPGR